MCGRTACTLDQDILCKKCTLNPRTSDKTLYPQWNKDCENSDYKRSYNIAPGAFTPVLTIGKVVNRNESQLAISPMRWGLVPSFVLTESSAYATSNARIESLLQKPSYKNSMKSGDRCVVLAQGFYEWKLVKGRKQPYYIHPSDPEKLLMMAGVFTYHRAKRLHSYAVITTDSRGLITDVHTRMPVILRSDEEVYTWLDSVHVSMPQAYDFLLQIAKRLETLPLSLYPVTPRMNSTKYDEPDCISPCYPDSQTKKSLNDSNDSGLLTAFFKRIPKREDDVPVKKPHLSDEDYKGPGYKPEPN